MKTNKMMGAADPKPGAVRLKISYRATYREIKIRFLPCPQQAAEALGVIILQPPPESLASSRGVAQPAYRAETAARRLSSRRRFFPNSRRQPEYELTGPVAAK